MTTIEEYEAIIKILFTFRPGTPVFIGIPRGEEFFSSLHPLFTPRNADKHRGFRV